MFLVNSPSSRFCALCFLLANLRKNFAEFPKYYSANTLVYSTCSLVSVLVQLLSYLLSRLFLASAYDYPLTYPFGFILGAVSEPTLFFSELKTLNFRCKHFACLFYVTHICIVSSKYFSIFYFFRLFCYLLLNLSFGI